MNSLLYQYLAGQAELGTDEVILDAPLTRMDGVATQQEPEKPASADFGRGPNLTISGSENVQASHPSSTASAGPLFSTYDILQKALEESEKESAASRRASEKPNREGERPPTPRVMASKKQYPAFDSFEDYWNVVIREYPDLMGVESKTLTLVKPQGTRKANLALAAMVPGPSDLLEGIPFRGEEGELLGRMLKAIGLEIESVYLTTVIKTEMADFRFSRREFGKYLGLFEREMEWADVSITLLLGENCARLILKTGKSLEELRQELHQKDGKLYLVSYHPCDLIKQEELKRNAWQDLKLLQKILNDPSRS